MTEIGRSNWRILVLPFKKRVQRTLGGVYYSLCKVGDVLKLHLFNPKPCLMMGKDVRSD